VPFEENYLDLWLSKPVHRGSYMLAKTLPTFAVIAAAGVIAGTVHAIAMAAFGLALDPGAYAGTIAAVLGMTLLMLAAANLVFLFLRDSFAALVAALIVFMATFVPSIVFMYRPDAYAGSTLLRDVLIFPTSLLWYPDIAAVYGLPIGLGITALALGLLIGGGRILARRDI
jgi:ABC-type Na+ efflux pump permease subunit